MKTQGSKFSKIARAAVLATASLAIAGGAQAQWHGHGGYRGGGGWHGAPWVWGGVGLGLGLGLASTYAWSQPYYPSYYTPAPAYVYAPPTVVYTQPVPSTTVALPSSGGRAPVVYPRNGQSEAQREADTDQCSQWAGQQPNATADRSVFDRAIAACMDGRGYTLR